MADNVAVTPGSGATIATDDVAGVQYQKVKLDLGGDGATDPVVGTLPISAASLPLPTGAATETTLSAVNNKLPSLTAGSRVPVETTPADISEVSYSQAGIITINTILLSVDCANLKSLSIQCTSMGTTGVVTPEWSMNNSTWVGDTFFTLAGAAATTFNAAGAWITNVKARYYRLRLSTATTAGTTTIYVDGCTIRAQTFYATQPVSGTVTANIGTGSLAAGTNAVGDVGIQYRANATGAGTVTSINCPATPAVQTIKGSAGRLLGLYLVNTNATIRWIKIYNIVSPTLASSTAAARIPLPQNQPVYIQFPGGMAFGTAITCAVTSTASITDSTGAVTLDDVTGFSVHA